MTHASIPWMDDHSAPGAGSDQLKDLLPLLACPCCHSVMNRDLIYQQAVLECAQCNARVPVVQCGRFAIAWHYADPDFILQEWQSRVIQLHQKIEQQVSMAKAALSDPSSTALTRQRIGKWMSARQHYVQQIDELLAPLPLAQSTQAAGMNAGVAHQQDITNYVDNIFRDWAWNNGENEHLLEAIDELMQPLDFGANLGRVLTLGAGAGRLPFDIHRYYQCDQSVISDINPLLLLTAARVLSGENVSLYEFPVAPIDVDHVAVLQNCRAPEAATDGIHLLFADVTKAGFRPASFNSVITPWLMDIIPLEFSELCKHVNQLLISDGVWLNSGSLAFMKSNMRENLSQEEVIECLEMNGFKVLSVARKNVPYLCSPGSAHGRQELLFSFCAKKCHDTDAPKKHTYIPAYIDNTKMPIPANDGLVLRSSQRLLEAQVLSAVDGSRSVADIAQRLSQQYGLDLAQATYAIQRILLEQIR